MRRQRDNLEKLQNLVVYFHEEANRCADACAYLAGCIMLGAALEGALVAMAQCFPDEVERSSFAPRRGKKVKSPAEWSLSDLLKVARDCSWLPANLPEDANIELEEALDKGDIGDFVEIVRELRNLVHLGRYVREYPEVTISKEHFEDCYEVVQTAFDHLYTHLTEAIQKELEKRLPQY